MLKIWLHEVTRKGACAQLPRYHFGSAKRFTLGQTCTSFQQRLQARRVASLGIADGNQEAQSVNATGLKSQPSIHMCNPSTRRVRARARMRQAVPAPTSICVQPSGRTATGGGLQQASAYEGRGVAGGG